MFIIILAHSDPHEFLFQLRNFGTPLLIVASGLTYSLIYENKVLNIISFYKKRLSRLTFPVWIFLTVFFLGLFINSLLTKTHYPFTLEQIIGSYVFDWGIGFVWIFKVYIILAIITPYALRLSKYQGSDSFYVFCLGLIYIVYEVLAKLLFSFNYDPFLLNIIKNWILVIFPFSILYLYGLRLRYMNKRLVFSLTLISLTIFVILSIVLYIKNGMFIPTQSYKYPPRIYYLSYAFFAVNILYLLIYNLKIKKDRTQKIILWLSKNALWIYLWHIYAYYLIHFNINFSINFGVKFLFMVSIAIILTYIQMTYLNYLTRKCEKTKIVNFLSYLQ